MIKYREENRREKRRKKNEVINVLYQSKLILKERE